MKYVMVNGTPVWVPDKPTGLQIKQFAFGSKAFQFHGTVDCSLDKIELQGHNANGLNTIIPDDSWPWHSDFTAIEKP